MTTAERPAPVTTPTESATPQTDRYVIGRDGSFATLWDCKENRAVVENATEEHCRTVRDELLAAYRQGQLAEQLHQFLDLDLDRAYTVPGCICACPPKPAA